MARKRETPAASCRRSEPTFASIRTIGQNSYAHSCVPMGTRTTTRTNIARPSGATLPADNGKSTRKHSHNDSERRRVNTLHATLATYSRGRYRMLWALARCRHCERPRSICFLTPFARQNGVYVTEALTRHFGETSTDSLLPY